MNKKGLMTCLMLLIISLFYSPTPQDSTLTLIYKAFSLGLAQSSQSWLIGFKATGWQSASTKLNKSSSIYHLKGLMMIPSFSSTTTCPAHYMIPHSVQCTPASSILIYFTALTYTAAPHSPK